MTIISNWATLPFNTYAKIFIADNNSKYQAQDQTHLLDDNRLALDDHITTPKVGQLKPLQLCTLREPDSRAPTTLQDNRLMVLISIARDSHKDGPQTSNRRFALQIFPNLVSIIIFVFASSIFAAVTLLALPMAQMILVLVVGSAIISRALVRRIVLSIQKQRKFLCIIVTTEAEAEEVLAVVFSLQRSDAFTHQIEINGNIFIDGVRITSRTSWTRRVLGLMAHPHDMERIRDSDRALKSAHHDTSGTASAV